MVKFEVPTAIKNHIGVCMKCAPCKQEENEMGLGSAIKEEASWGKTANGADAKVATGSALLDMFGRAGAMRGADAMDKQIMISQAFKENADLAVKLLFYTRDVREGYGERDTFNTMLRWLAFESKESVEKNLWAILEFGRASDLYALVGTPAEDAMWEFMRNQFELDYKNMQAGKSISLLAKWMASPNSRTVKKKQLGKLTAKALGYSYKNMRELKQKISAMRKYLDLPEVKMAAGKWSEIEYSTCASKALLYHKNAFARHDEQRWQEYLESVNKGEEKMNTGTLTPCDIVGKYNNLHEVDKALETMWDNLEDVNKGNVLVMADTSGSMFWGHYGMRPIDVSVAMAIYFAKHNKGDLKNTFMTFESDPHFIEIKEASLFDTIQAVKKVEWGNSTNLEKAFDKLLETCIKGEVSQEEMPEAILVVSDMQINDASSQCEGDGRMTFFDRMSKRYEKVGYKMPQLVFWNVNAQRATFHASKNDAGASLVSGFSVNVFKQVIECIGSTPYELMMSILESERYKDIVA